MDDRPPEHPRKESLGDEDHGKEIWKTDHGKGESDHGEYDHGKRKMYENDHGEFDRGAGGREGPWG